MPFTDHKLETFTRKISDLPDEPKLLPNELKACFDSSPEELRQVHNDLCESLDEIQASAVHFTMTAGVPEENVQDAIENVQEQLTDAIMGNIPSGSVTQDKLAQDVRNRFSAIESAATTEASTRANADSAEASVRAQNDSSLQSQINSHTSQIGALTASKCEIYVGTYTGNDQSSQYVNLSFAPKAVLICNKYRDFHSLPQLSGGMAIADMPVASGMAAVSISGNGFYVYSNGDNISLNDSGLSPYGFIALK